MRLTILLVIFIMTITVPIHCYLAHNQGQCAFAEQCTGTNISKSAIQTGNIEKFIVEGGRYLYYSASKSLAFLGAVEAAQIDGFNYPDYIKSVESSILYLEISINKYRNLLDAVKNLEYDPSFITKLECFDYDDFEKENNLNSDIFKIVKDYLKKGDVKGSFKKTYMDCLKILAKLKDFNLTLTDEELPEIKQLWSLNQGIFDILLFGQYCAEVYKFIGEN